MILTQDSVRNISYVYQLRFQGFIKFIWLLLLDPYTETVEWLDSYIYPDNFHYTEGTLGDWNLTFITRLLTLINGQNLVLNSEKISGLLNLTFIPRWPLYRVTLIPRLHCTFFVRPICEKDGNRSLWETHFSSANCTPFLLVSGYLQVIPLLNYYDFRSIQKRKLFHYFWESFQF